MMCLVDRAVTTLISSSNMHAITTLSGHSETLTEEQCIAAQKKTGGIELREIDARRLESDLRKTLKMDRNMRATDRVLTTIVMLEAFLDKSMLRDIFETNGRWVESAGRMVAKVMLRGIQPTSFRERVTAQLRFEGKDENLDEVQAMMLDVAQRVDAEKRGRVLDMEYVQRIAGDRVHPESRRSETERQQARSFSKPFQGHCFHCNVLGHRASDCPSKLGKGKGTRGQRMKGHLQDGRPQEPRKCCSQKTR